MPPIVPQDPLSLSTLCARMQTRHGALVGWAGSHTWGGTTTDSRRKATRHVPKHSSTLRRRYTTIPCCGTMLRFEQLATLRLRAYHLCAKQRSACEYCLYHAGPGAAGRDDRGGAVCRAGTHEASEMQLATNQECRRCEPCKQSEQCHNTFNATNA